MADIIKTDGTILATEPKNGTDFSLKELQGIVNGYIEVVNLRNGQILVINDVGKFSCPVNEKATEICQEHDAIFWGDYICGDVLLCNQEEVQ